nr:unnamed protein product [Digitaria exilis]
MHAAIAETSPIERQKRASERAENPRRRLDSDSRAGAAQQQSSHPPGDEESMTKGQVAATPHSTPQAARRLGIYCGRRDATPRGGLEAIPAVRGAERTRAIRGGGQEQSSAACALGLVWSGCAVCPCPFLFRPRGFRTSACSLPARSAGSP